MTAIAPPLPVLDGRYEVRALLGKRGRCSTFLALDRQTLMTVALKEIRVDGYESSIRAKLEDAVKRLSELEHPRIPRFLGVVAYDHEGPKIALVVGYVKGKTIAQHVAEGRRFDPAEALAIAKGTGEALAYLHSRQPPVLHGSISPSHVLLDAYDSPLLIDFGVIESVLEEAGVPTGEGGGPPKGYVPFEQFAGRPVPASDVYSLGMTLVFALTGRDPLQDAAAWDRAKIDPLWPEPLRQVISGMTAASWESRWRSGTALVKALPKEPSPSAPLAWLKYLPAVGAAVYWLILHYLTLFQAPLAPGSGLPSAILAPSPPSRRAATPLFTGDANDAAKRFLGAEHESGQIAWEQVHGRIILFVRGRALGYSPAFRGPDGTLALVENGKVYVGRPENWRRRIPDPDCQSLQVALDEYENVWIATTCGKWRYDDAWHKTDETGPLDPGPVKDPAGLLWVSKPQGDFEVGEGAQARIVKLWRTPSVLGHDHEGRVWALDGYNRVTVYDRQRLLEAAK